MAMWAWMGQEQTWAAFSMLSQYSRPRVFQVDVALVALELDASGCLKIHGIGHQRSASNRVGWLNSAVRDLARDLKCFARFRNGVIKNRYQELACIDLQCIVAP